MERLGVDEAMLAAHVALPEARVRAMLDGLEPLDADAAVRFARALGLGAERLMQMQIRYDFSQARDRAELARIEPIRPASRPDFPVRGFLQGRLRRTPDGFGDGSLFFQEELAERFASDSYAGLHALWRGDRLRIYEPTGGVVWIGPLLQNFDGRILLPYERAAVWNAWFASGFRADLAIGAEHEAFFERMREA